jgi:long-chain acyl-CoA synthetase
MSGISWNDAIAAVTAPGERFELIEDQHEGRTQRVFRHTPPSLRALFETARARGDETFLVYEDERWSFGDVMAEVDAFASVLVDHYGISKGDRVAIGMRNYPEWVVAFAAITSVGAIAVCLNAWWTEEEIEYGIGDSGARLMVADAERAARAGSSMERHGLRVLAVRAEQAAPKGVDHWSERVVRGPAMPEVDVAPGDDATILYTSGTTGHPKGAVSSQRAVLSALMAFGARAAVNQLVEPSAKEHPWPTSFILVVPLFHVTGLIPVMMSAFSGGAKLVMMYKWNPERALELIEREHVTHFVGVPTMSWDLLESPDFARRDTSSLSNVGGGGAPAPPELVRRVEEGFRRGRPGIGYGMTETNAYGPGNAGNDYLRKPRSAGRTLPLMPIKVADENGNEVPRGEVGEIFFSGPTLIRGYWNKPEATAETIVDGWLRSGDIGRMDEEGFIFVEDRAKDMVLRAGENVYCAEVEAAIYQYPGIYEAAVFGIPHPRLGEEVAAAVHPKPGVELDVHALRAFLKEHIAPFKIPSVIRAYEAQLPRNASGKILKRDLRDELVAQIEHDAAG